MATPNLGLETIEPTDKMKTSLLDKMNNNFNKIDAAYRTLEDALLEKTNKDTLTEAIDYVDNLVNAQDGTITADKVFNGYVGYKGKERIVGTALATTSTGAANQLLAGQTLYTSSGSLVTGTMVNKAGLSSAANGSLSGTTYRLQIPTSAYYNTGSYLTRSKADVISDLGIKEIPTINVTWGTTTTNITSSGAGINKEGVLVIWALTANTNYEHVYFYPKSIGIGTKGVGWDITSWDTGDPVACYACTVTGLSSYSTINVTLSYNTYNATYDYVRLDVTITGS